MAVCRNIETTSQTGLEFMDEVSDTLAAFTNYLGGMATAVSGTDTITVTIEYLDCLTALPNGFSFSFVAVGPNNGPVTLAVNATDSLVTLPAKTLLDRDGSALNAGALLGGTIYTVTYRALEDSYRLQSEAAVAVGVLNIRNVPLINVEEFISPGTFSWTAPYHCAANISAFGGGGGKTTTANGGAGGTCRKTIELLSGEVLNFTIGAGSSNSPGANTTVTGPNLLNMVATGGGYPSGGFGGAGGTASGGEYNLTGGAGAVGNGNAGGTVGLVKNGIASVGLIQNFPHEAAMPFPFTSREYFAGQYSDPVIGMGAGYNTLSGDGAVIIAYSLDLDA